MLQSKEYQEMRFEAVILITVPIFAILSLIFVPKKMLLQAHFIFLFVQLPTWILGLTAVQLGLIEYPYRELSTVNRTSFIFEFLVLPIICIHFYVHFPESSSKVIKCMYYFGITLVFTVIEFFLEKYTLVLKYTGWQIYWSFVSVCFIFWLSRKTTLWLFKGI
jgi:hypothetical protein